MRANLVDCGIILVGLLYIFVGYILLLASGFFFFNFHRNFLGFKNIVTTAEDTILRPTFRDSLNIISLRTIKCNRRARISSAV